MKNIEYKISEGLVKYPDSQIYMENRVSEIIKNDAKDFLWLLEHPPLYTAGTSANDSDLLEPKRFNVFKTGRGGEYTYHGPGQRVAYVMLNLTKRKQKDIRAYVYNLEEWIIKSLEYFSIKGERRNGRVGIWVKLENGSEAKIAAIGVRVRKWVTFHGIAVNINPNLNHFSGIIPCGLSNYGVTSMFQLGVNVTQNEVDKVLIKQFERVFY